MDMEREEGHFDDVSGHYVEGIFFLHFFWHFLAFLLVGQKAALLKSTLE
jgi:hypothetical protein